MNLPTLPTELSMVGSSPDLTIDEIGTLIAKAIADHPRSQQIRIGPSEIGQPCPRRIAYKLLGQPERDSDPAWLPTIGTAVHTWLERVLVADNAHWMNAAGHPRWFVETRVNVGTINGVDIEGNADVYDRVTGTVIDWKIVGPTTLRGYKAHGPGDQYRAQAHLYGRGFTRAGLPVDRVMIAFLPRNAPLDQAYFWHEPYDEQIALDALQRADGIATGVALLGHQVLDQLPAVESYCRNCPYLDPGSTDLVTGCPGAEVVVAPATPALTLAPPA